MAYDDMTERDSSRLPVGLTLETGYASDGHELILSFPLRRTQQHWELLSPSERDVVEHLLAGATYHQIARRRGVSFSTVANQVAAVFRKTSVHSRIELAILLGRSSTHASP